MLLSRQYAIPACVTTTCCGSQFEMVENVTTEDNPWGLDLIHDASVEHYHDVWLSSFWWCRNFVRCNLLTC